VATARRPCRRWRRRHRPNLHYCRSRSCPRATKVSAYSSLLLISVFIVSFGAAVAS
jgi:hypothetical protein